MTRRIVNSASIKKQDNMSSWVPTVQTSPGGAGTFSSYTLAPSLLPSTFLFCPSAREIDNVSQDLADRNAQLCYARGYKETCDMRIAGGMPFRWRRIVFRCKGLPNIFLASDPTYVSSYYSLQTSPNGYVRQTNPLPSGAYLITNSFVFKGSQTLDWINPLQAKVDTQKVDLMYDKTISLNPGNQTGSFHTYHHWFPVNKNIQYSDDEAGAGMTTSAFSTQNKPGCGDVFIYDLFESNAPTGDDRLNIRFQGTWYWHEK